VSASASTAPSAGAGDAREFSVARLVTVLALPVLLRVLYQWAQPGADPTHADPAQDGAYYLDWARAIVAGEGGPAGAFYLAPLFPYVLALLLAAGGGLTALYVVQQGMGVATALLIALGARERLGPRGALIAAVFFLLHHPLVFFYARPLGEPLALLFLVGAVIAIGRGGGLAAGGAGVLLGAATLARPNLLLVLVAWAVVCVAAREWRRLGWLALGSVVVVAPVAARNAVVSGHLVPVSSNAGITAYHGNGPGARGVFTFPSGFSGTVAGQRGEATALARHYSGRSLDDVEADRWWGRQALALRLSRPWSSLKLLARRAVLLVDNYEYGLDAHPLLDRNPWRPTLRFPRGRELALVPFALLLGLAVTGWSARGVAGSGGRWVWSALLACAATPLLFYVSSRYRLPLAALLTLPAGAGLDVLLGALSGRGAGLARAAAAGFAVTALSLTLGWTDPGDLGELRSTVLGEALSNRAVAFQHAGDLQDAEREARRGVTLAPRSSRARYNLGVILDARGKTGEAERTYVGALELSEGTLAEAATNLAKIYIERGDGAAAVEVLVPALEARPMHESGWANLIVALVLERRYADAREALRRARALGVPVDPGLAALVEGGATEMEP
jgi:tetratricopeptide (TPR) repeat protein